MFRHKSGWLALRVGIVLVSAILSRSAAAPLLYPPHPTALHLDGPAPDYPGAIWAPAAPDNYQRANRPVDGPINMVVIHDIEGSAEGAVEWMQNPASHVTAHYVVSSMTGRVYQVVRERDVAWHAGNRDINRRSIGIEHEGFAYRPGFYNPQEYETSARLVRWITTRYGIPRDRAHIIGHSEVPNPFHPGQFGGSSGHTDPGPYWDWESFMTLVRNDAHLDREAFPAVIHPGEMIDASATFTNTGDDPWPATLKEAGSDGGVGKGVVYLGTWAPAGRISPYFNYQTWTSPRFAASARVSTPAGQLGTFRFALQGPRSLGKLTRRLRLTRVPIAPYAPVAFGDTLAFAVQVKPWDINLTTASPGFKAPGWIKNGSLYWRKTTAGRAAPAAWNAPLPISGRWDIYVRWTPGHSRKVFYQVEDADGAHTYAVDQRHGGGWRRLGRFAFGERQPAVVKLSAQGAPGAVVADGIRLVGPFPKPV